MPREIDNDTKAASQEITIIPAILVRLDYPDDVVTLNTVNFPITYNGETYYGVGELGEIGNISEDDDLGTNTLTLQLSGVDNTNISQALQANYQGRDARVFAVLLDSHYQIIGEPVILFRGKIDNQQIEDDGETSSIAVSIVGRTQNITRPKINRYNNADQQKRFPGDNGLQYVEKVVDKDIMWGK